MMSVCTQCAGRFSGGIARIVVPNPKCSNLKKRREAYGSRTLTGEKRILLHRAELHGLGGQTPSAVDRHGAARQGQQETRRKNAGRNAKGLHDSQGAGK